MFLRPSGEDEKSGLIVIQSLSVVSVNDKG